jgi:O-succinylhomoserine sulfhydrylase
MGGAVLGDAEFCEEILKPFIRNTGPALSPFNAWVLLKGLETLELRVEKQSENALEIARFLEAQPGVSRVLYPGLKSHPQFDLAACQMTSGGTMVSFELGEAQGDDGKATAFKFENALEIIDISNNLGDTKSLITHPPTTTHQRVEADERARMGIRDNLLRISVGLEDIDDLKEDLSRGLDGV